MSFDRFFASLASAIGNVTLFGSILAGWPGLPLWTPPASAQPRGPIVLQLGFRPYIVDGGHGSPPRPGPQCPHPELSGWPFELDHSPLPWSFDPTTWSGERSYACVRLDGEGRVLGVTLIGVREPQTARALIETVRRDWRFFPVYAQDGGWIRIRLNAAPWEPPSMPPILD
jgi:hypothetical protein